MLRQKKQISLRFPLHSPPHLADNGSRRSPGQLIVRVHAHRMFARWAPATGRDNPPVFHGQLEQRPDELTITGTIRETRAVALLPMAFLLVFACGIALLVLGIASSQDRAAVIAVGAFLTVLFGVLLVRSLSTRRPRFLRQAGQLEYGLDTYLRTGEVDRLAG